MDFNQPTEGTQIEVGSSETSQPVSLKKKAKPRASKELVLKAASSQVDEALRKMADQEELPAGLQYAFEELHLIHAALKIGPPDVDALDGLACILTIMRRLSPYAPWTDLLDSVNSDLKTSAPKRRRVNALAVRRLTVAHIEKALRAFEKVHKVPGTPHFFTDESFIIERLMSNAEREAPTSRAKRGKSNLSL